MKKTLLLMVLMIFTGCMNETSSGPKGDSCTIVQENSQSVMKCTDGTQAVVQTIIENTIPDIEDQVFGTVNNSIVIIVKEVNLFIKLVEGVEYKSKHCKYKLIKRNNKRFIRYWSAFFDHEWEL